MQYRFTDEPADRVYRELLDYCGGVATHAGIVVYREDLAHRHVQATLRHLEPHLVHAGTVDAWPAVRLAPGFTAQRYLYKVSADLIDRLSDVSSRLYEWDNPSMPNDLHFLSGATVVLAVIAHEDLAWLQPTLGLETVPPRITAMLEEQPVDFFLE